MTTVTSTYQNIFEWGLSTLSAYDSTFVNVGSLTIHDSSFTRSTFQFANVSTAFISSGALTVSGCTISGAGTLFDLQSNSNNVQVNSSNLWSSLNVSNASTGYVVINRSPYDASMAGNYWGDALEAVTSFNALSGQPVYRLSNFIYDVYKDATLGEVIYSPWSLTVR